MSLFSELKDLKVFRVAAVYLVVAWLIMQVVAVVSAPLLLPEWFARVVILLLTLGFPFALIISWAFDVTTAPETSNGNSNTISGKPLALAG
jgi:adenylate cyclase